MGKATRRMKQAAASASDASPSPSAPPSSSSSVAAAVSSAAEPSESYERRIRDLEQENRAYQIEVEELKNKLGNVSITPESVKRLKDGYLQKLNALEEQVKELKKKQDAQSQLSTYRRGNNAGNHLHDDIQKLKAQKVQLQCQVKLDAVRFRSCKAALEKEILQLKKEGRKTEFEMKKILAANQRQMMVLQRKNEENFMASNRLKSLLESRKLLSSSKTGTKKGQAEIQGVEREFEVTEHINKICAEYEHQIEVMAHELTKANEEAELLRQENFRLLIEKKELDSREDPELQDLKENVSRLSNLLCQLESRKAKLNFLEDSQEELTHPSISAGSSSAYTDSSTSELEISDEKSGKEKKNLTTCCSCSKRSLCKTTKCECRNSGGNCGIACGCSSVKCTNREELPIKLEELPETSINDENLNPNSNPDPTISTEAEKIILVLDTQEAIPPNGPLLEPAETYDHCGLKKMPLYGNANTLEPADTDDHCGPKKMPLYGIANTLIKSFASKHNQRRRARN